MCELLLRAFVMSYALRKYPAQDKTTTDTTLILEGQFKCDEHDKLVKKGNWLN